jgi:hypothetical protein
MKEKIKELIKDKKSREDFMDRNFRQGVVQERMASRKHELEREKKKTPKLMRNLSVASTIGTAGVLASPFVDGRTRELNVERGKNFYKRIKRGGEDIPKYIKSKIAEKLLDKEKDIPTSLRKIPGLKGLIEKGVSNVKKVKAAGNSTAVPIGVENLKELARRSKKVGTVATGVGLGVYGVRRVLNSRKKNRLAQEQAKDYVYKTKGGRELLRKTEGDTAKAIKVAKRRELI